MCANNKAAKLPNRESPICLVSDEDIASLKFHALFSTSLMHFVAIIISEDQPVYMCSPGHKRCGNHVAAATWTGIVED